MGDAPLHCAALNDHKDVLCLLLGEGTKISAGDIRDFTPLHFAVSGGHTEIVNLLLDKGADPLATDEDGRTPLHLGAGRGRTAVSLLLLDNSADISATANDGTTPLHWTSLYGHKAASQLLLAKGADVLSRTNGHGWTAKDLVTAGSHHEIAAMLKAEAVRRVQCEALAMGQHERLGTGSGVQELEVGVVKMVLEYV
ncbi:ankyrin repeat-containing domain protein [Baffinella frigidus]|nr:ankyrin repeat-containing domain protein [Cryptophyta sp. CCMP2293]